MNRKSDFSTHVGVLIFGLVITAVPAVVNAADAGALAACQAIEDNAARLACYDAALTPEAAPAVKPKSTETPAVPQESEPAPAAPVADETEPAAEPAAAPTPAPTAATQPATLSDDIGRESVSNVDRDALAVRGRLARCVRASSGKLVFYFDNGQVWRQKSSGRVPWRECDFDVTIGKDVFGYTMIRDGEKRKVRVERVK